MNKQELIDKAVEDLNGNLPKTKSIVDAIYGGYFISNSMLYIKGYGDICYVDEFIQRASELGWCNGYKYGVEYETSGKKPDLPDDVLVETYRGIATIDRNTAQEACFCKQCCHKFRIVDDRYKPVSEILENNQNVSVLTESNQDNEIVSEKNDWFARGELPPVGTECEVLNSALDNADWEKCLIHFVGKITCVYTSESCTERCAYLDFVKFRPIKSEREKFHDAALELYDDNAQVWLDAMFNAGFKAPN